MLWNLGVRLAFPEEAADLNTLGLPMCDVDSFTIHFCRAVEYRGSAGLCHEDENLNGGGRGSQDPCGGVCFPSLPQA